MSWKRPNIGSRVNREVHARFWERAEVKFLRATRQSLETIVQELRLVVHRLAQNIKFLVEHLRLVGNPACNRMWTAQHIHYGLHRFHSEFSPAKLNFALSRIPNERCLISKGPASAAWWFVLLAAVAIRAAARLDRHIPAQRW